MKSNKWKAINGIQLDKQVRKEKGRSRQEGRRRKQAKRVALEEDMLQEVSSVANDIGEDEVKKVMRALVGECFFNIPMCLNDNKSGNRFLDAYRRNVSQVVSQKATKNCPRKSRSKVRSFWLLSIFVLIYCLRLLFTIIVFALPTST